MAVLILSALALVLAFVVFGAMQPPRALEAWAGALVVATGIALILLWRLQAHRHRKELLARTGERDRLLRLFYDLPFMGMAIVDPHDGQWLHINARLCEMLGYSHEEMLAGTTWQTVTHPDDLASCLAEYRWMLVGESDGYQMEKRFLRQDGSTVEVALSVKCVRRLDGAAEYIVQTIRDISDQKRLAEAKAGQQRATGLLESIAAASTDAIFAKDGQGRYLFYNNEAARAVDRRPDEVVGHGDADVFPGELAARIRLTDREIMDSGEPITFEETLHTVDGERAFLTTKGPLRDGEGRVTGLFGISRDITARKFVEDQLRRSQKQLQTFIEHAPISIAMFDREMNTLAYSRRWLEDFGRGLDSLTGRNHYQVHPDLPEEWRAIHRRGLAGETLKNEADHWIQSDGVERWLRWAVLPWRDTGGAIGGILISAEDITDRRRSERALRYQLDLNRGITEQSTDSIFVTDAEGRVTAVNPEAERTFGQTALELHGRVLHDVIHHHYPDGRPFPMSECPLCRAYATGEAIRDHEAIVFRKDGSPLVVTASNATLVSDSKLVGVALILHDITAMRRSEQALRDADQRKDEFLAMLAHELRNPLVPIRNAAHVLGRLELEEPRVRWAQNLIERQVAHLTHLVDELLDVSRIARGKITLKIERVDLADLVRQAAESVRPLLAAKGHHLELSVPDNRVVLEGDLVRLIQVLQNLLHNALKYTPDGGRIELQCRPIGQEVEILVRDNGMGIPADLLPGVFDLFRQGERTLDRAQGGLGIGLTLVRRLVELHGGRVEAASDGPGRGASFRVVLPLADAVADPSAPSERETDTGAALLRVLVVDDDPVVAESMLVFLELEGHQVCSAASGEAALRLLAEFRPRVVLLDIGLPDLDGYEVARRIRLTPGGEQVKLVAVSGYGHEAARERGVQAGFDVYLVKPVAPSKLAALLAEIGTAEVTP